MTAETGFSFETASPAQQAVAKKLWESLSRSTFSDRHESRQSTPPAPKTYRVLRPKPSAARGPSSVTSSSSLPHTTQSTGSTSLTEKGKTPARRRKKEVGKKEGGKVVKRQTGSESEKRYKPRKKRGGGSAGKGAAS